jgi:hypothetical protein
MLLGLPGRLLLLNSLLLLLLWLLWLALLLRPLQEPVLLLLSLALSICVLIQPVHTSPLRSIQWGHPPSCRLPHPRRRCQHVRVSCLHLLIRPARRRRWDLPAPSLLNRLQPITPRLRTQRASGGEVPSIIISHLNRNSQLREEAAPVLRGGLEQGLSS